MSYIDVNARQQAHEISVALAPRFEALKPKKSVERSTHIAAYASTAGVVLSLIAIIITLIK